MAAMKQYFRSPMGVIGLLMLLLAVATAVFAPWLAPYNPKERVEVMPEDILAPPDAEHLRQQPNDLPVGLTSFRRGGDGQPQSPLPDPDERGARTARHDLDRELDPALTFGDLERLVDVVVGEQDGDPVAARPQDLTPQLLDDLWNFAPFRLDKGTQGVNVTYDISRSGAE